MEATVLQQWATSLTPHFLFKCLFASSDHATFIWYFPILILWEISVISHFSCCSNSCRFLLHPTSVISFPTIVDLPYFCLPFLPFSVVPSLAVPSLVLSYPFWDEGDLNLQKIQDTDELQNINCHCNVL